MKTIIPWISIHKLVFILSFCLACPLWGQVNKKDLKEKDFSLWHTLTAPSIAANGAWISYHKYYDSGADTLVLQNTITKTQYLFPEGAREQFLKDNNGFLLLDKKGLTYFDLNKEAPTHFEQVRDYKTAKNGDYFAALRKDNTDTKKQELLLVKSGGEVQITIPNVYEYTFDESNSYFAFSQKIGNTYQLGYLDLQSATIIPKIIYSSKNPCNKLVWGANGALAFFEEVKEGKHKIVHWLPSVLNKEKYIFDTSKQKYFDFPITLVDNLSTTLHFSPDASRLFFHITKDMEVTLPQDHGSKVQVWNSKDILIAPVREESLGFFDNPPIMVVWNREEDNLHPLGNKVSSKTAWGSENAFVFTYSFLDDQSGSDDPWEERPIMVYNTRTGESKFVVSRTAYMPVQVSPTGRYLSYFDENNWWIYDAVMDSHKNITRNIPATFRNSEYDYSGVVPPYGLAGWTENDAEVLLYDLYDMWAVVPNGEKFRQLTNGNTNKIEYRVYNPKAVVDKFNGYLAKSIAMEHGLLLEMENPVTHQMGISLLSSNGNLQQLIYGDFYISNLVTDAVNNAVIYTQERYDVPPGIMAFNTKSKKSELIFQSNPQHFNYKWGKSKLVDYEIENGDMLQGALFYPANYVANTKYPMVVYIYEKLSNKLHKYENPSLFNGANVNITNLTQRGYFVFCPDIVYELNEPGISALRCVTAGVEKVLETEKVDKKRLGLFGHSFGGYQTSFIVTQTDLFATAISGAGYHDIPSFYLSVAWLWHKPQAGRFLNNQQRFEKTYFETPELYKANSPMEFVENIKIPLLTYTGNLDTNINWQQSIKMYNALRVLGKEHIMLLYPNEGHDLFSNEAQIDFTNKMWDWFDHYLKGAPKKTWMQEFK
jgi:dienelactone hydrolase